MANFLAPADDYAAVASFCNVKTPGAEFKFAVDSAASEVEQKCGPVLLTTISEPIPARASEHVLRYRAASVASLVPSIGEALPPAGLAVSGQRLWRLDGGRIPVGTVTYTSGWPLEEVPLNLRFAGSLLARHLWRTQLGNQRANEGDLAPGTTAWLWPAQARELARPFMLAPTVFA